MSSTKAIAFFGASGGCGLAALKHSLAAGHTCIALCRTPSKMTDILPTEKYPNLIVKEGNAHNLAAVSNCVVNPSDPTRLVDTIVSSIGSPLDLSTMTIPDPDVCKKGMATLLEALGNLRKKGATGKPRLVVISTTGISNFTRDVPVLFLPMYHIMLKMPHADKKIMEERILASDEDWTLIRPSFLVDGESDKTIRVGVEDLKTGRETKAVGYTISREDVGKWMFENVIKGDEGKYSHKAVSITY
jgi:putative NADH-flavin reductase